jgi:hypothetical protein
MKSFCEKSKIKYLKDKNLMFERGVTGVYVLWSVGGVLL